MNVIKHNQQPEIPSKRLPRSNISPRSPSKSKRRSILAVLLALYVVFILVSQIPLIAEQFLSTDDMVDRYECVLTFPKDGRQGHYYVERYDTSKIGRIDLEYVTKTNSLDVDCRNIKVLRIYCREMYEDKSEDVFYRNPELDSNYYKTYFITRDYFHVSVYTEE